MFRPLILRVIYTNVVKKKKERKKTKLTDNSSNTRAKNIYILKIVLESPLFIYKYYSIGPAHIFPLVMFLLTWKANCPEKSYMPQECIRLSVFLTASGLSTRSPVIGQMPPLARVAAMTLALSQVTSMEHSWRITQKNSLYDFSIMSFL